MVPTDSDCLLLTAGRTTSLRFLNMNFLNPGKSMVIFACAILLQISVYWVLPVRSLSTGVDNRSLSSSNLSSTQRINRNNPSSTRHYPQNQTGTDFIALTRESLPPTIAAFPISKTEPIDDSELSAINFKPTSSINTEFQLVKEAVSPLNSDTSNLPNSDFVEIATPSFLTMMGEPEIKLDQIDSTRALGDSSTDPKVESEPFLTILVNSPPQIPVATSQLQSSSIGPLNSVDVHHSYPLASAPNTPFLFPITTSRLPLLPLESVMPSTEKIATSPLAEAFNNSALTLENLQIPVNLTVFPSSPANPLKIEFNSYAGHGTLYQALPPFYGIIYPVSHSILSYPFGQQIELERPKNKPATSYGSPRSTYVQIENNNYQRPFGHPPTARALGFPSITNTHDNLHREVNWYRVGRASRSAGLA